MIRMPRWSTGALVGVVVLAMLTACGGGDSVSGPRVRSAEQLAGLLRRAELGCVALITSQGTSAGMISGGSCGIEIPEGSRALLEKNRRWCSTDRTPKPPLWYRCQLEKPDQPASGRFGFAIFRTDDDASTSARQYAAVQCRARPDESVAVYQVRGPNWVSQVSEVAIGFAVADALDATLVEISCPS